MTLMQIQELTFCSHHRRGLIVLGDVAQRLTLAFDVHPDEVPRLARMMKGSQQVVDPLYDFIHALLEAFLVTPTDVVLDDVPGKGLMAFVQVQRAGTMLSIPCYAPDALSLAAQMQTPIYATEHALVHAEPRMPDLNLLVHGSEEDVRAWLAQIEPTDFRSQRSFGAAMWKDITTLCKRYDRELERFLLCRVCSPDTAALPGPSNHVIRHREHEARGMPLS